MMRTLNINYAYSQYLRNHSKAQNDFRAKNVIEELGRINLEISETSRRFGYKLFPDEKVYIGEYGLNGEIARRFLCHNQGERISQYSIDDIALVTGFGTTDSPSPGTLSMIFRMLDMQKNTGIYVSAIVSDFACLNSRRINPDISARLSIQFINFIENLGFDFTKGELRTHKNKEYGKFIPIVTSTLSISEFNDYKEATDNQYKELNIFRGDFALYTYKAMMATDILLPIAAHNKKAVLVTTGLEEHYHPNFARYVANKFRKMGGGYETIIPEDFQISAFYSKVINGFYPYAKMSRSIPESSLCIGDSESEIINKLSLDDEVSNIVIYQMMESMSGWDDIKLNLAKRAFEEDKGWKDYKEEFMEFFLYLHSLWRKSEPKDYVSFSNYVFDSNIGC